MRFTEWYRRKLQEGGSANDPSNVEDEGDGGDGVLKAMEKPPGNPAQAFPTYTLDGSDLPVTDKNRRNFARKKCRKCGKN